MNIEENSRKVERVVETFYKIFEDYDVISSLQRNNYTENKSYLSEYPSILIFLSSIYGREFKSVLADDISAQINRYAALLVGAIKKNEGNNASLCYGFTGIAYAFHFCFRRTGRFEKIVQTIEEGLVTLANQHLQHVLQRKEQNLREEDYDLIMGLSSAANYLLRKDDLTINQQKCTKDILDYFVYLMEKTEGKFNIIIQKDQMVSEYLKEQYPDGYINLGISHGILGPMYALCNGYMKYHTEAYRAAVERGLEIYRSCLWKKYDFVQKQMLYGWPERVDLTKADISCVVNQSWCYGSLGMARAIYAISKKLGDEEMQELSINVGKSALKYPLESDIRKTNAICHGKAGMVMMLDRMYQDTRIEQFREVSQRYFDEIVEQVSEDSRYLFKEVDIYFRGVIYEHGYEYFDLGLLNGSTGIILALLGHTDGDFDPLNSMLLI